MKSSKKNRALLLALIIFLAASPVQNGADAKDQVLAASIETAVNDAGKTTQQLLDEAQQEKEQTESQLEDTQDQIDDLNGEISSLQKKLNQLNDEMQEVSAKLEDLGQKITAKEQQIQETRDDLAAATEDKDQQYANMLERIRFVYERGETYYLEILFDAKDFSDLLTRADYIQQLEDYDRKMLIHYQEVCELIADTEALLVSEAQELEELRAEQQQEQERIEEIIASTTNYVTVYKDQVEEAERLALEYERQIEEQEKDIKVLTAKLEEEKRLAALAAQSQVRDLSSVTFAEGDRYLLANLIYCEAGGEIYAGKLAVGAVVINRLLNGAFPDTIVGVIYQKNQFSPAGSGRLALALAQNRATNSCYQAADEAMRGVTNVAGCLFFRTPTDKVTPVYVIGGHVFY